MDGGWDTYTIEWVWSVNVNLGGRTLKAVFKVFPSSGDWSMLVGKLLLKQF